MSERMVLETVNACMVHRQGKKALLGIR